MAVVVAARSRRCLVQSAEQASLPVAPARRQGLRVGTVAVPADDGAAGGVAARQRPAGGLPVADSRIDATAPAAAADAGVDGTEAAGLAAAGAAHGQGLTRGGGGEGRRAEDRRAGGASGHHGHGCLRWRHGNRGETGGPPAGSAGRDIPGLLCRRRAERGSTAPAWVPCGGAIRRSAADSRRRPAVLRPSLARIGLKLPPWGSTPQPGLAFQAPIRHGFAPS